MPARLVPAESVLRGGTHGRKEFLTLLERTMKLALLPSERTALPTTCGRLLKFSALTRKRIPPSPREYPSARSSNVWHQPKFDKNPATVNASELASHNRFDPEAIAW